MAAAIDSIYAWWRMRRRAAKDDAATDWSAVWRAMATAGVEESGSSRFLRAGSGSGGAWVIDCDAETETSSAWIRARDSWNDRRDRDSMKKPSPPVNDAKTS